MLDREQNKIYEKGGVYIFIKFQKKFLAYPLWVLEVLCANKRLQYLFALQSQGEHELWFKKQIRLNLM